jgi:hypothetical protein
MIRGLNLVAAVAAAACAVAMVPAGPAAAQSVTIHTGPDYHHHDYHHRYHHRTVIVHRAPVVVHRGCRTVVTHKYYRHHETTIRRRVC